MLWLLWWLSVICRSQIMSQSQTCATFPPTPALAPRQSTGKCSNWWNRWQTFILSRWYYLPRVGDCVKFPWGGCHGNDNNFISVDQCRATCRVTNSGASYSLLTTTLSSSSVLSASSLAPPVTRPQSKYCLLPPESGPCQDRIQRFYFDSLSGSCLR